MSDARPLHRRLADDLRGDIEAGRYPRGSRLPSEHELAGRHAVARGTVRQALSTLRAEGAIAVRRGARPVVLGPTRTQSFSELQSFTSWARGRAEVPSGRVVELGTRPATDDEANALGLEPGDEVLGLVRVRLLNGRPVMIERTAFVPRVGTLVSDRRSAHRLDLRAARRARDRRGAGPPRDRRVAAGTLDAELLGVARRTPLLRDRRLGLAPDGAPIEWSDDRYRPDAVAFGVDNATTASPLTRLSTWSPGVADVDRRAS